MLRRDGYVFAAAAASLVLPALGCADSAGAGWVNLLGGHIGFQNYDGRGIEFRNVRVKRLDRR